ncbi:hypothetical protein [Treponema primitia]|uniref:hypothetical protein n=1 Tax=Treponema primitia TaxID=88058 RepID=UPI0011D2C576|nr:hypothetical protein [Treponema primitia]
MALIVTVCEDEDQASLPQGGWFTGEVGRASWGAMVCTVVVCRLPEGMAVFASDGSGKRIWRSGQPPVGWLVYGGSRRSLLGDDGFCCGFMPPARRGGGSWQ